MLLYMSGGLIQLVAYGAQDVFLTGNPTITFFKTVYKRHTTTNMKYLAIYLPDLYKYKSLK